MKRADSNENALRNTPEYPKMRNSNEERHLGYEADDQNDIPPDKDDVVVDHGADSDGDNDDEINNDVTSPNNPGAEMTVYQMTVCRLFRAGKGINQVRWYMRQQTNAM